jgi:hypothetical protein
MSPWNYPGFYYINGVLGGAPVGPRQGPSGRNNGATLWGQFLGGYIKYYAGAYDLNDVGNRPLISTRINLSLLNPEPGYYHSSTYYGGKDIVALGASFQSQAKGSVQTANGMATGVTDDYTGISVDLLAEKNFAGAGVATVEGAFYKFNGDYEGVKDHFYALASYLLPFEVGIGKFQPLFRFQQATLNDANDTKMKLIDAALSYVVDDYNMRFALTFQNQDIGGLKGNAVQLGIQVLR